MQSDEILHDDGSPEENLLNHRKLMDHGDGDELTPNNRLCTHQRPTQWLEKKVSKVGLAIGFKLLTFARWRH